MKRAATLIPSPLNKRAWRSISECYHSLGRDEMAELADLVVNAEELKAEEHAKAVVRVAVVPLPMLSQALREFFTETGTEKTQE